MKNPVRRLVLIALVSSLWLFLAVIGLRSLGQQDQFQAFDHPLLKDGYWLVAWGGDQSGGPIMSEPAFKAAANLHPKIILGAAIHSLRGGDLVVADSHFIYDGEKLTYLRHLNLEEWRALNPFGITLDEFIAQFSGNRIYLNLDRLNTMNQAMLLKSLAPLKSSKQVLIKSSPQGIKKKLKEKQPLWLFSNTTAEMGKLKLMQALYLEPVASLNADFFVDKTFAPRVVTEIHRRFKKALLQHRSDDSEATLKAKLFDGIVTTQPSDFISLVD